MITFIDDHKAEHGIESICSELPIAVSIYYAAKSRPPSQRQVEDEVLLAEVVRVHAENYGVYGRRKIHAQMNREGFEIGRDRCERLMRQAGIAGVVRGKKPRTTVADEKADLVLDALEHAIWVRDTELDGLICHSDAGAQYTSIRRTERLA